MIAVARRALLPLLLLTSLASPASALAAHANDSWTTARAIDLDTDEQIDNSGAGPTAFGDPDPEPLAANGPGYCNDGAFDPSTGVDMTRTLWWKVTGNGYPVTIDTRNSDIDTVVAVYERDPADPSFEPSDSTFVTCNNDIRGGASPNRASETFFNTFDGTDYYIQVGCLDGTCEDPTGGGIIDFIAWSSPPGDFRDEAIPLKTGVNTAGDNRGGTTEADERNSCDTVPYSRSIWYRWTAPGPGTATFVAGGTFDSVIAVYRGTAFVGCSDDPSEVTRHVTAGDYYLQVGVVGIAPNASYGTFNAKVNFTADIPPRPDRDGDGIPDASDKCPDQNASARDADRDGCLDPDPDADHDGVLGAADKCPTENASGRDANHDGCLDPLPPKRISVDTSLRASATSNGIKVVKLRVVQVPKGAKVTVRCGHGCRFAKTATVAGVVAEIARSVTAKTLAGRSLKAGQKIRIYVTKRHWIGAYVEYRISRGGWKKVKRCLNPGSMTPRRQCH
jgi:hypothetical protein